MTMKFIQGDPPPMQRGGKRGHWRTLADELRQRPGTWAEIATGDPKKINGSSLRKLGCQVTTRTSNGVTTLYARWPHPES